MEMALRINKLLCLAKYAALTRCSLDRCFPIRLLSTNISKELAERNLKVLNEDIRKHNYLYYNACEPAIGDTEYDLLIQKKKDLEKLHPDLYQELPIGAPPSDKFTKFKHTTPMLSLDNSFTNEDVMQFTNKLNPLVLSASNTAKYVIEPKVDGISLSLHYDRTGTLIRAVTRGNGAIGEDVTANVKCIIDIPNTLHVIKSTSSTLSGDHTIEIRGELYMSTIDFDAANASRIAQGLVPFSTPRNAAAGSLRQLATDEISSNNSELTNRKLKFFAYQVLVPELNDNIAVPDSQLSTLKILDSLGFKIASPFYTCNAIVKQGKQDWVVDKYMNVKDLPVIIRYWTTCS